ncbi:phage protein [Streptococcus pneumoniae]|nr:phage protein [Streptococcus pneumoniae]
MTYKLTGSPILKGEKNVTIVTIEKEKPGRYSYERVELPGNRTHDNEEVLIQAVLDFIRTELDPTNAIVQAQAKLEQTLAKLEQAEQKVAQAQTNLEQTQEKLSQAEAKQNDLEALANRINKVVRVMAQDSIMGEKVSYGTTYKEMVELFPLAEVGKVYEPGAIFAVEDPSHAEINGEGKRILIQTNQSFTYQGETLAQLEGTPYQNGVLAPWKFNAPKATIVQ